MSDSGTVYVTLDQWVHLAAEVLGVDPATIRRSADLDLADSALHAPAAGFGDQDTFPDLIDKAAVLCWHLVNKHALPDGNKRCAFVSALLPTSTPLAANQSAFRGARPRSSTLRVLERID